MRCPNCRQPMDINGVCAHSPLALATAAESKADTAYRAAFTAHGAGAPETVAARAVRTRAFLALGDARNHKECERGLDPRDNRLADRGRFVRPEAWFGRAQTERPEPTTACIGCGQITPNAKCLVCGPVADGTVDHGEQGEDDAPPVTDAQLDEQAEAEAARRDAAIDARELFTRTLMGHPDD